MPVGLGLVHEVGVPEPLTNLGSITDISLVILRVSGVLFSRTRTVILYRQSLISMLGQIWRVK